VEDNPMDDKEVFAKLVEILRTISKELEPSSVKIESRLEDDLGLDSVDLMDAIYLIENGYSISIVKEGIQQIDWPVTVGDLIKIIQKKIGTKVN
jgi:acyl carrier protein